jgi:hypothetical protein
MSAARSGFGPAGAAAGGGRVGLELGNMLWIFVLPIITILLVAVLIVLHVIHIACYLGHYVLISMPMRFFLDECPFQCLICSH